MVHSDAELAELASLATKYDTVVISDEIWAPLHMVLNYQCLNQIEGLHNPTSEVISKCPW